VLEQKDFTFGCFSMTVFLLFYFLFLFQTMSMAKVNQIYQMREAITEILFHVPLEDLPLHF